MSPARRAARHALPLFLAAGFVAVTWAAEPGSPSSAVAVKTPAPAQTAPVDPLDLGRGLRYCRLDAGATDDTAFAAAKNAPALVLDLRNAGETSADVARLRELLATRDAARPLFVLLGATTPATLRDTIIAAPGVLTLAGKDSGVAASVVIAVDPARALAAAEALAAGRVPRELVEEKIEKTRFDEARLTRNHANGRRESDAVDAPKENKSPSAPAAPARAGTDATSPTDTKPVDPAPPETDVLLQRAVFLHRALLALGRIPEHT